MTLNKSVHLILSLFPLFSSRSSSLRNKYTFFKTSVIVHFHFGNFINYTHKIVLILIIKLMKFKLKMYKIKYETQLKRSLIFILILTKLRLSDNIIIMFL